MQRQKTFFQQCSLFIMGLVMLVSSISVAAEELKIGYVRMQEALGKSPQYAAAIDALKKEFEVKKKNIVAIQSELETLRQKWERDALTMSETEKKELQNEVLLKDRDFRWQQQIYDEDLKIRQSQLEKSLRHDILKAIVKISQDEKYDLILSDSQVLFGSNRVNLTERVLEVLKKDD